MRSIAMLPLAGTCTAADAQVETFSPTSCLVGKGALPDLGPATSVAAGGVARPNCFAGIAGLTLLLALAACGREAGLEQRGLALAERIQQPMSTSPPDDPAATSIEAWSEGAALSWPRLWAAIRQQAPELQALRARARAELAMLPTARAWADPRFSAELAPASLDLDEPGYTLRLSQMLPWGSVFAAREEQRLAMAQQAVAELELAERRYLAEARTAYADYWLQASRLALFDEELAILDGLIASAEAEVAGGGRLSTLAEAQARRAELAREQLMARREQRTMGSGVLARLLGLTGTAELPPPPAELPLPSSLPTTEELLRRAASDPAQEMAGAARQGAIARQRLASLNGRPDLEVMASWSTMEEMDEMRGMVGLAVTLPVQRGPRRAERDAAGAEREAAEAELRAAQSRSTQAVLDLVARLEEQRAALALLQEQELPAREQAVRLARASLAGGDGSMGTLSMVLELERMLLATRQRHLLERRDYSRYLAELAALCGPAGLIEEDE